MQHMQFSEPQRQSPIGVLILFVFQAQKFFRAFWPLLLVAFFKGGKEILFLSIATIVLVLTLGIISYLKYYYFTFYIDYHNNEFIINSGIINKTRLNIPLEKIQQVHLSQNLLHKITNIYKVVIDTAGSKGEEASISALTREHAVAFKQQLQEAIKEHQVDAEIVETKETSADNIKPQLKISFATLAKIGLTSKYKESISLFLLAFIYIVDIINRIDIEQYIDTNEMENTVNAYASAFSVALLVLAALMILLLVNFVRTVIKFYGYSIFTKKDSILFKYGLIKTKEVFLKPFKVQILIQRQNWFQKKLNLSDVYIEQATSGTIGKIKEKLQIPGVNNSELEQLKQLIFSQIPSLNQHLFPNIRKWLVPNFILSVLLSMTFVVLIYYDVLNLSLWFLLPLNLLIVLLCYLGYKNSKVSINDEFVQIKGGVWDIDYELLENYKIQGIKTQQFFWQKRYDVGSVTIFTAAGNIKISTYCMSELVQWSNYWLYKTETSDKRWM